MAADDPPPKADTTYLDDVDPAVRTFMAAMDAKEIGLGEIDAVSRKLYTYKVSLYFSVDDPDVPNAVRKAFAKWLNELSKFSDLRGANLQVTNCNDEFLLVPSLLYDAEFKQLTGWDVVKPGKTKNVYICVKMKASLPFSRLKYRMKAYLFASNTFMKRNHSLGDSSEEMVTIGYLSPIHPDLLLANLQTELNTEIQCINAQKDDDFLAEHGVHRGVHGDIVIAHGAVRGSSKQHGEVVNSRGVIVECPKSKMGYYVQTVQDALRILHWSPDMRKIKFVPFALRTQTKTKEIFTNMIVYNSLENQKKSYTQILGVSREDMLEIRTILINQCPTITHIDPTSLTNKQGRWKIYTGNDKLASVEDWLKGNLSRLIAELHMSISVPGFATPRIVLSNRISSVQVQEIAAISTTVPNLDDASVFPNLVVHRRPASRTGAWTSSPHVPTASTASDITPATVFSPPTSRTVSQSPCSPSSPFLRGLEKQLETNRQWRVNLELARTQEKAKYQALSVTITSLSSTVDHVQADLQQHIASSEQAMNRLADGQSGLHVTVNATAFDMSALRANMTTLTQTVDKLLSLQSANLLSTPPRLHRTDRSESDIHLSDSDSEQLCTDHKRSPDGSPNKQHPRVRKSSRIAESMTLDDTQIVRQP